MAQALLDHGFSFDLLSLFQDLLNASEVDIGWRQVPKALVVALVVVVSDKVTDRRAGRSGQLRSAIEWPFPALVELA